MLNPVTPHSVIRHLFVGAARPPAVIWLPALVIAALLLIAPVYLAIRTVGAGPDAAELIFRTRTLWVALHRELRELGCDGGYSILKGYVSPRRRCRQPEAMMRFETAPGEQAQVDWGSLS